MEIKSYTQHAPVLFGSGAIQMVGEKAKELGCKKVLCVFDAGVKAAGIGEKALASLNQAGIQYVVFDRVLPDPPDYLIDEADALAKQEGIDGIIGIGGGSSMDTAKAISILQKNPGPITNYMNLNGPPIYADSGVPTILVPTSAGTGSEVTNMCIITHTKANTKVVVLTCGTLAIVDPELCMSAPAHVTAYSGLDALAHAAEAITANGRDPYSEQLAVAAIRKIADNLITTYQDPKNTVAREEMSLASNWAGIAFANAMVHIGHGAADSVSASYGTPHGLNCAWTTPPVLELVAEAVPDKVKLVGEALGVSFAGNETPAQIGKMTGDACRKLMHAVGIKTMKESGFDRDVILSGKTFTAKCDLRHNCPVEITEEVAEKILASAYDDYC